MSSLNMSDTECCCYDTWEDFFGGSTELMPTIMGAFDAIIENTLIEEQPSGTSTPKKSHQCSNFAHLSAGVQKLLSHVPDQEITKTFSSEETLGPKRTISKKTIQRNQKSFHKSNESLDIISSNVQKMLSNFPDNELVISPANIHLKSCNSSFLHSNNSDKIKTSPHGCCNDDNKNDNRTCTSIGKSFLHRSPSTPTSSDCDNQNFKNSESGKISDDDCCVSKPLGSYSQTPHGIASRNPVGRKNLGKYLQVPSETSVGTTGTSSTVSSSEVSRPVSLTSLGSCSSSGSSGPNQPGSAYLASAESLDSDPEPTGSQGSADSGIAEQSTVNPEMRVLQEVLDTEAVYVADLNEVIQGYLEQWKDEEDCILANHLQDLFSNIIEVYEFNKSFLDQLREADFNPSKVANVFLQNDSGFSVYNEYCTNYPRTMEVLGRLTRDEKTAPLFREKQIALGHALPLGSYLLKPVQRILKYHLLLQRLAKQCDDCHKPAVDLALTTMTGVACGINNMKMKHEHAVRVQEIQAQLYGWIGPDLTALGELVAEGVFRVNGAKGRRHVFLFDKVLLIAKSKQDGALGYKSHIMTSNLMLVEHVRGEPLSFQILPFDNPRLTCTLRARSPQHKREWTLQIKRVMLENYTAVIPSHARQLVLQLGQDMQETDDASDKWSPLKQHSTPHYLERRTRVRKSRDLSNSRRASSQDRSFPNIGGWRRKSDPTMIPQYSMKALPKKISKVKKAKEGCSKFYTDLSDCETCNLNGESVESLATDGLKVTCDEYDSKHGNKVSVNDNIEKIVSDLLMQNSEFQKVLHRQRRSIRDSEPNVTPWLDEERPSLPSKADSLPRSFQLNDQSSQETRLSKSHSLEEDSIKEQIESIIEEKQHSDLSSRANNSLHPEHKIYRNTGIRMSLLQRVKAIISEQQKNIKYPLYKQGSRSMGEKLANPDYVDPQKFLNSSCSTTSLTATEDCFEKDGDDRLTCDFDEPDLDMSFSETEVLTELEKRLQDKSTDVAIEPTDTGQSKADNSSQISPTKQSRIESCAIHITSSHNSDSYYESLLDEKLVEEYIQDENGRKVLKQDSFRSAVSEKFSKKDERSPNKLSNLLSPSDNVIEYCFRKSQTFPQIAPEENNVLGVMRSYSPPPIGKKPLIKRPNKAPPPIPAKPIKLLNGNDKNVNNGKTLHIEQISCSKAHNDHSGSSSSFVGCTNTRSWVKTMVDRFE